MLTGVRTTINIDDDVLETVKAVALRDRKPVGVVVSGGSQGAFGHAGGGQGTAGVGRAVKAFLPDVNTQLALLDPMHLYHETAHSWYAAQGPIDRPMPMAINLGAREFLTFHRKPTRHDWVDSFCREWLRLPSTAPG